jgi:hypothetical protein
MILSLITAGYALQVSDRRVSLKKRNRYEPWDPASNKSIVLLGHDGLISMGYTGPAFISKSTMDGWIAEAITGSDLGASRERPDFGHRIGSGVPDRVLHAHLKTLEGRLNEAVAGGRLDRSLDIYGVGMRWNSLRKPVWPTMIRISWNRAQGRYLMAMSKRRWGWESGRSYQFAAAGWSEAAARRAMRIGLRTTDLGDKDQAVATLIDILRSLPPEDNTVGKDCLVTTIQREPPHVHIKYEAYDISQVQVAVKGQIVSLPAAFSPWILTPTSLAAPQAISGPGSTMTSGLFEFRIEGSASMGDFFISSSQPRLRL